MTKISMKALLGAGAVATIAAISLTQTAQAQQPGSMTAAPPPGYMSPDGQPGSMTPQPYGQMPPQNAYAAPQQGTTFPSQMHQLNPRYPGPAVN